MSDGLIILASIVLLALLGVVLFAKFNADDHAATQECVESTYSVEDAYGALEQLSDWDAGLERTVDAWLIANDELYRARHAHKTTVRNTKKYSYEFVAECETCGPVNLTTDSGMTHSVFFHANLANKAADLHEGKYK